MMNRKRPIVLIPLLGLVSAACWQCGKTTALPTAVKPVPGATGSQPTTQPASANDWFVEAEAGSGIDFTLGHREKGPFVVNKLMGGGVSIADFDGDGRVDILVVAPEDIAPGRCAKIFKNLGSGKFQDMSAASGLDVQGMIMGCAAGDIDNDGLPDILITGYGLNKLYKNRGGYKFVDITAGSGLEAKAPNSWASSSAFADYDNDGRLDVYVGRYVIFDSTQTQLCDYGQGHMASCGPVFYDPQLGGLYRNVGDGKFKDVTQETGFGDVHGKVLGVVWADVNHDGRPDCYIANDEVNADLFISGKDGKYKNVALVSGVALSADGKPQGGMGVDWGDYNRDGRFDLFVTTYQNEPDSLYSASESGLFQWESLAVGIDRPSRLLVGFGTKFLDVNNDGWLDLAVANGHIHDNQEIIDNQTTYKEPMQLFVSSNEGKTFLDKSKDAGSGFTRPGVGRGLAIGDLDDDGRQDVVIMDMEGPTRVLFNRTPHAGTWLSVTLKGARSNRQGLGSIVTVVAGKDRWVGNCTTSGSYLSSNDPRVHFGLGAVQHIDSIEVKWPSGKASVVKGSDVNKNITIEEPR